MCNYISKIVPSLQHEFIKIRFNNINNERIVPFLSHINKQEKSKYSKKQLHAICSLYGSDIRSMINYMQTNHINKIKIINNEILDKITTVINTKKHNKIYKLLNSIVDQYHLSIYDIIIKYINYILINPINSSTDISELLNNLENIIHSKEYKNDEIIHYFISFVTHPF